MMFWRNRPWSRGAAILALSALALAYPSLAVAKDEDTNSQNSAAVIVQEPGPTDLAALTPDVPDGPALAETGKASFQRATAQ